jgi:type II secretory pathway pseudopilin PulG
MRARRRSAFTLYELLIFLGMILILLAFLLPAVVKVRLAAARIQSTNNIKQIGLSIHDYESAYGKVPAGVDENNFSAAAKLLPFIEQANLYNTIDFKKSIDDKANAAVRKAVVKTFLSPQDGIMSVRDDSGATNYLFNDLAFYRNSKASLVVSFPSGTSVTIAVGETLKGGGGTRAEDVHRQYILLKADALKGIKDDAGVSYWKDDKDVAGDRCASWMDGRFLQGTFNGKLKLNDERPDVNCGGEGGVSTLRTYTDFVLVGMGDASARTINPKALSFQTWSAAMNPNKTEPLGPDW